MSNYVRVYYSIVDDERFAGVYDTPLLATWLRLLMVADAMWPATAYLPATERRASVQVLVDRGLVELLGNGRFRIHGLDAERGRRSESAAVGGRARQRALSERSANAVPTLSLDETSRAKQSKSTDASLSDDRRADLDAWLAVKFRIPTEGQRRFLDTYCRVFDVTGPDRAAQLIYANSADPIAALKADLAAFQAKRIAEARAAERPKPRHRPSPGLTGVNAEIAKLVFANDHESGRHAGEPDPACHLCEATA